jgi:hypothetical protein
MRQSSAKDISSHRRTQYLSRRQIAEANTFYRTQLYSDAAIKLSFVMVIVIVT